MLDRAHAKNDTAPAPRPEASGLPDRQPTAPAKPRPPLRLPAYVMHG